MTALNVIREILFRNSSLQTLETITFKCPYQKKKAFGTKLGELLGISENYVHRLSISLDQIDG